MSFRQTIGRWGENIAAGYYQRRGFTIIARNWRCRSGELDLICARGRSVYIVEVKTRRSEAFGGPEEAVTALKYQHMRAAAALWLGLASTKRYREVYFQIFSIVASGDKVHIMVYTDE